jgi:HSP20 family protein
MAKKFKKKAPPAKPRAASTAVPVRSEIAPVAPIERAFDRLLDHLFRDFHHWPSLGGREPWWPRHKMPPTDVYEEKDQVVVKAELPGMGKEDVNVTLADHTLTIKGEKTKKEEVKEENYHRWERSYGSFVRVVDLPTEVKSDDVKAEFKDGVLTVRLPKSEEVKHKQVQVKVD